VEAKIITKQYGLDGVLIGRGAIGNPGIFSIENLIKSQLKAMMDHACYYLDSFWTSINFLNLRKNTRIESILIIIKKMKNITKLKKKLKKVEKELGEHKFNSKLSKKFARRYN